MDPLPEGWTKIEGFHGFGRDIYLALAPDGAYQIMSKDAYARTWTEGKRYLTKALGLEIMKDMQNALEANYIATHDLMTTKKLPGYGRF